MSEDTDELINEAIKMNLVSKRIKICFQYLDGQIGFDIDYRKRASMMSQLIGIDEKNYPVFDDEDDYRGYIELGEWHEINRKEVKQ